jgi:hypothetical protein
MMADNVELFMRFHPVAGEDISVISKDFSGEKEALEAVAEAINERRSLVLSQARPVREGAKTGVVINAGNVVSVQVSTTDGGTTGQYL